MTHAEFAAAVVSSDFVRSHGITIDPGPKGFSVDPKGNLMANGKIVELTDGQRKRISPFLLALVDTNF